MIKKVIVLGGQGDGAVVASFIESLIDSGQPLSLLGFLNDSGDKEINGYPVLGRLGDASAFCRQPDIFFISALLKVKQSYPRAQLIESLNIPLARFISVVHPSATIAKSAKIGCGTAIGPQVTVMPNAVVGDHCSLRASANVGHDCLIEDFCYLGPNASLAGRVTMKRGAHLAPNASVLERKTLGKFCVVGIGSAVVRDVGDFAVVFGCPARKVGQASQEVSP